MNESELIPHLFRSEYQKIVAVLVRLFGMTHVEMAEDIASDTFLTATESWSHQGIPDNPTAWLYAVAKNKTKNYLKRNAHFEQQLVPKLREMAPVSEQPDLSPQNIFDSQLAMIFAVCSPVVPSEVQIALALYLLCGFGAREIADAFLTNKEVIYKRINRGKEKLKEAKIPIAQPAAHEIGERLDNVLTTLYLLFSEGYYSTSQHTNLRKDCCMEAMRLTYLLLQNAATDQPQVNALMALMCFHASRFDARATGEGESVLYQEQNEQLWNQELILRGTGFLNRSSSGTQISRYHLEAGIAYWHTQKEDSVEKWKNILDLYDHLLAVEYSPVAALNRAYALSKVHGKQAGIAEAEKLSMPQNPFYQSLLGNLYTGLDHVSALRHYQLALELATSAADRQVIRRHLEALAGG